MPSWQDARDKIRRDLWRPGPEGVPDATLNEAIHLACLQIESERPWLWREVTRLSDPFGGKAVNIPIDCGQIRSVTAVYADSNRERLSAATVWQVRARSEDASPMSPGRSVCLYARTDTDIILDAPVEDGTRLEIVYISETPPVLENAVNQTNMTIHRQFQATCALAASIVAATWLKDNEEAQRQAEIFSVARDAMIQAEDARRQDAGLWQVAGDTYYQDLADQGWG
jgi:hypothetical protein